MEIELQHLAKRYAQHLAVDDLSLVLAKGEMVALLGPSGCGKTTTLRMVAGFIAPTSGRVLFRGRDVTMLPPHRRDTGLVFQSYALFPHLNVADNIAFGLRRRGVPRSEQTQRIAAIIETLELDGLDRRLPRQLSGGQQQRVAVARALVINPAVLLLDEPFSNLDAKLRESTGLELRRVQRDLGLTSIFVTHDQSEAMSIADRIAVMNAGRIEQIGSPADIYERPATPFVAQFIGRSNFLPVTVEERQAGQVRLQIGRGLQVTVTERPAAEDLPGSRLQAMLRPEHMRLVQTPRDGEPAIPVTIEAVSYQGSFAHVIGRTEDGTALLIQAQGAVLAEAPPGARLWAAFAPQDIRLFPAEGA